MPLRSVPGTASVAHSRPEGKLFAPSAARNLQPICALLQRVAPPQGNALELASGTGQHIVGFAAELTGLCWQPSEADPQRRDSIDRYAAAVNLPNLLPAIHLDATAPGWGARLPPKELIVLSNLLHLISNSEAETLIAEVSAALSSGGVFVLYGPFMRAGQLISRADQEFHRSLRAHDAQIGYKGDDQLRQWGLSQGLKLRELVDMPANNLSFVFTKHPAQTE